MRRILPACVLMWTMSTATHAETPVIDDWKGTQAQTASAQEAGRHSVSIDATVKTTSATPVDKPLIDGMAAGSTIGPVPDKPWLCLILSSQLTDTDENR